MKALTLFTIAFSWLLAGCVSESTSITPASGPHAAQQMVASASGFAEEFDPKGAVDRSRFSMASAWKGTTNATSWWWQMDFNQPRAVGAILQIVGDHEFVFRNAPRQFV